MKAHLKAELRMKATSPELDQELLQFFGAVLHIYCKTDQAIKKRKESSTLLINIFAL